MDSPQPIVGMRFNDSDDEQEYRVLGRRDDREDAFRVIRSAEYSPTNSRVDAARNSPADTRPGSYLRRKQSEKKQQRRQQQQLSSRWRWLETHVGNSVLQHAGGDVNEIPDLRHRATFRAVLREILVYMVFMVFNTVMTTRGITEADYFHFGNNIREPLTATHFQGFETGTGTMGVEQGGSGFSGGASSGGSSSGGGAAHAGEGWRAVPALSTGTADKTFHEITTVDDFYRWMEGPLAWTVFDRCDQGPDSGDVSEAARLVLGAVA